MRKIKHKYDIKTQKYMKKLYDLRRSIQKKQDNNMKLEDYIDLEIDI